MYEDAGASSFAFNPERWNDEKKIISNYMAKIRTHYDNLKVAQNAPDSVIKAAYKALCQTYHPDKYQGDKAEAERIMKIINTSYNVLIDPIKRAEHDAWIQAQEAKANQQSEKTYFDEDESEQEFYQQNKYEQPASPEEYTVKSINFSFRKLILLYLILFVFSLLFWAFDNILKILWGEDGLEYIRVNGALPFILLTFLLHFLNFKWFLNKYINQVNSNEFSYFLIIRIFFKTMFIAYFMGTAVSSVLIMNQIPWH